jgi:hypothetical protein
MARKYARDNRGRFAPKGAGATARGGRLKTASGKKRETQKIATLSGDRMSSVPKGAIGKTRKQREITMIDRPIAKRPAYNAGRAQQQAAIAARKAPKATAASKRIKAAAPSNTVANKTGQSKTLNKFNSRPEPTRGKYVNGRYVDKAKLTGRQPLDLGRSDDRAFGRVATKAARARAASKAGSSNARLLRAEANVERTKNAAFKPGKRRLTTSQVRSQLRADTAVAIYKAPSAKERNQIIRNQKGLAKSERAKQNWLQTRDMRVANAQGTGLSPVRVGGKVKPASKPARKAIGRISEAKAARIVSRVDANRPGQRRLTGSPRRTANALRTEQRAREFLLAPSRRAIKKGQPIGTNESVRRAIANASKKRR